MDYSAEPGHSPMLNVQAQQPFNAEPTAAALVEFPITPDDLVYCRNHGPVRDFDEQHYTLRIAGHDGKELCLSVNDIKTRFPKTEIVAMLQCAGLRRKEMAIQKQVQGVPWADGVVANCKWAGARLCDVLQYAGLAVHDCAHVCFDSHATLCQDDSYYGASIPIAKAMDADGDVLLAYEMNDEPLGPHRGGPIRVVVPGYLGARWTKWLDTIILSPNESPNFYQQRDYKILPPTARLVETQEAAQSLWDKYPSMTSLPLNSVVGSVVRLDACANMLRVKGYAVPGASRAVARVEVTVDEGATWTRARIVYQESRWTWTIWEANVATGGREHGTVRSRAVDAEGRMQPCKGRWNMRGVAYDAWGVGKW